MILREGRLHAGLGATLAALVLGMSSTALAQGNALPTAASIALQPAETAIPAGGIPFGPLIVFPAMEYSVAYNDNLFLSNSNKVGSAQTTLSPSVRVEGRSGAHRFGAVFRIDDGRFLTSSADNFTDYSLSANASLVMTGRASLNVRGEYRRGHDPRGSTDRIGSTTPDEFINQGIDGIFSYGAPGARGRIELDGGVFSRQYQNNRAITAASDRNTSQLGATFLVRVAPKTEALALVQRRNIDYVDPASTQDSIETRYQVGAKWDATAKTAGIVKFGRLEKAFDTGARTSFSGSSWDGTVRWSPLTYSIFDFNSSKGTSESTGTADFLVTRTYGVNWNHAWNSRFSTAASASWRKDDFLGAGGGRIDKTGSVGLRLSYQWQRWLRFGGEYSWTERTSNPNTFDYTRQVFMLTVGATL